MDSRLGISIFLVFLLFFGCTNLSQYKDIVPMEEQESKLETEYRDDLPPLPPDEDVSQTVPPSDDIPPLPEE